MFLLLANVSVYGIEPYFPYPNYYGNCETDFGAPEDSNLTDWQTYLPDGDDDDIYILKLYVYEAGPPDNYGWWRIYLDSAEVYYYEGGQGTGWEVSEFDFTYSVGDTVVFYYDNRYGIAEDERAWVEHIEGSPYPNLWCNHETDFGGETDSCSTDRATRLKDSDNDGIYTFTATAEATNFAAAYRIYVEVDTFYSDYGLFQNGEFAYQIGNEITWYYQASNDSVWIDIPDDTTPPGIVEDFTTIAEERRITLTWTNPSDFDFAGTMIRYAIGDTIPQSQFQGMLLIDDSTSLASESCIYIHDNLITGQPYSYSAFTYDLRGNFSDYNYNAMQIETPTDDDMIGPDFTFEDSIRIQMDESYVISGYISDSSGVYDDATGSAGQGVYFIWDNDGELDIDYNEIQMDIDTTDINYYTALNSIPGQTNGIEIIYKVYAYDNDYDYDNINDRMQNSSDILHIFTDDDGISPTFSNFSPTSIEEGLIFDISCDITDVSGVYDDTTGSDGQGIYLRWDDDGELNIDYANELKMSITDSSGDTFTVITDIEAPSQSAFNNFVYQVYAYDNDYDDADPTDRKQGISALQSISAYDEDTEGPTFNDFSPTDIDENAAFYVQCDIIDPSGIYDDSTGSDGYGVYLLWDYNSSISDSSNEITMSKVFSGIHKADEQISGQPIGTEIFYKVYAYDNDYEGNNPADRTQGISNLQSLSIADISPPNLNIGIAQNPLLERYVDIYVFTSEPLNESGVSMTVDDSVDLAISCIDSIKEIWHVDYELSPITTLFSLIASAADIAGNDTTINFDFSAKFFSNNVIEHISNISDPDGLINFIFPQNSL